MNFIQQLVLLLLTAALIPLVFRWIDQSRKDRETKQEHKRNLERMRYEADLTRQSRVIDAQGATILANSYGDSDILQ